MPRRSKLVHPLAVLRVRLNLTQTQLAKMIRCSASTIQSIELNRLKLSDSLATKICAVTGVDFDWLTGADPEMPMPALLSPEEPNANEARSANQALFLCLFDQLFSLASRLPRNAIRKNVESYIGYRLNCLRQGQINDAPELTPAAVQFFEQNPKLLNPELKRLFNFNYIFKQQRQARKQQNQVLALPWKKKGRSQSQE